MSSISNTVTVLPKVEDDIVDVWSRAATKYRVRAALMLVLLAVLFGGLCCFTFWLRTGSYSPWEHPAFRELFLRSFTGADGDPITLVDFLTHPIPVQAVPIHAVIMGLQLASLCSIPILIAILYRLPASVPFCAMIVFLAAMPWLGIAIQLGCIIACVGPFRFRFRYASALIALLPVGAYFIGASWRPQDMDFPVTRNQALLYAPWVLALLASCVISALALAVARFINFRPGGIPPLLAILFAIPVVLFHANVGRHELEYRILEEEIGIGPRSVFAAYDLGKRVEDAAVEQWQESGDVGFESLRAQILSKADRECRTTFESERLHAMARCNQFLSLFPDSQYCGNVLYLKARMLDMRIDEDLLTNRQLVVFRTEPPRHVSRETWEAVAADSPQAVLAAPALFKLAFLDTVDGQFDAALKRLDHLLTTFAPTARANNRSTSDNGVISTVFERRRPGETLGIQTDPILANARRLAEMIRACQPAATTTATTMPATTRPANEPLQLLFQFDPNHPQYSNNLSGLIESYPDTPAASYARVYLARSESAVPSRLRQLRQLTENLKKEPAGAMAAFFLADLLEFERKLTDALTVFEELVARYPDSCWASDARPRLAALRTLIDVSR